MISSMVHEKTKLGIYELQYLPNIYSYKVLPYNKQ